MSDMKSSKTVQFAVCVALVAFAAGSRFIGAEANIAAVSAAALFAGFFCTNRVLALCVPLCAMLLSDFVHGFYHPGLMAVVYAMLALPVLFRTLLSDRPTVSRVVGCSLLGSVSFYLFTNLGVWALGDGTAYTKDAGGLLACYVAGVPFFRNAMLGDLAYSGVIFGAYAAVNALLSRRSTHGVLAAS